MTICKPHSMRHPFQHFPYLVDPIFRAMHSGAKCQFHAHNTRSRYLNKSDPDINYIYIPTDCGTSLFKILTLNEIFLASWNFLKIGYMKKAGL